MPRPAADLVFSGSLYVDMIPDGVPVPWATFSSAVGESGSATEATSQGIGSSL